MSFDVVMASKYLAALCCSGPCFLILFCSAYLAFIQRWVCNERHAYTSPHVDGPTAVPHIRPHTQWRKSWLCSALCTAHTHTHALTALCIPFHMCPQRAHVRLQPGGVVKCGTLVQVAMTDLEDVVDGGGQRLAYEGYL